MKRKVRRIMLGVNAAAVLWIRAHGVARRHRMQKRYITGEDGAPYEGMPGCASQCSRLPWPCEAAELAEKVLEVLPEPKKLRKKLREKGRK